MNERLRRLWEWLKNRDWRGYALAIWNFLKALFKKNPPPPKKQRLSLFTVKEIGDVIKPSLEKLTFTKLKPIETGEIVHVSYTEITLNNFKIEVSEEAYEPPVPPPPRPTLFLRGLTIGFLLGLMAIPASAYFVEPLIHQWLDEPEGLLPVAPKSVLHEPVMPKAVLPQQNPLPVLSAPVIAPPPEPPVEKKPVLSSETMDDVTDTLTPSGLPMPQLDLDPPQKKP